MPLELLTEYERSLWNKGIKHVAGVDEVGRGCFAGPMVVAAVIINHNHVSNCKDLLDEHRFYEEINDSKKLTAKKRDKLSVFITNESVSYSIVEISNKDIDILGLTKCTQIAFSLAIKNLKVIPEHVLTDSYEIKVLAKENQTNLNRGDNLSVSIAAASIIAKVYRDNLMIKLHSEEAYKKYAFDKHKGYGTKLHREMLKKHGYSDLHRKSFKFK